MALQSKTRQLLSAVEVAMKCAHCNFGLSAVVVQKISDPIQKLYVDKVREFAQKSKETKDGMYGAPDKTKQSYEDEKAAIKKRYGADSEDFSKFPQIGAFKDPEVRVD